jgi:sugar phosphate isomerase/epimerase
LFGRLYALKLPRTDHVGMCLDLGHANLCAPTRNDYLGYLDRLDAGVPIIHLHVHENWGDCDSHLPLFTGPAGRDGGGVRGFVERIKRRNYSGSIILEQWPHPPSLLNQAREGLKQLLAEAN